MSTISWKTKDESRERGRKGGESYGRSHRVLVYIEGHAYTYEQIAARLKIAVKAAGLRVRKARVKRPTGMLLWEDITLQKDNVEVTGAAG